MHSDDLAPAMERFFNVLREDSAGRAVLADVREAYHFRLGPNSGLLVEATAEGVAVTQTHPEGVASASDVTRLACEERTLRAIIDGRRTFWDVVIPMSEDDGAIVFIDNWMAKKGAINQLGRVCRMAQERHGFLPDGR